MTDFRPLDLLGTIGNKRSYDDLLADSTVEVIEPAVLPTLRATLAEIRRLESQPPTTSE
jgi:hypothetical protein